MAENSKIEWTDHTFNPWIGCTKVSVGEKGACENCYAEVATPARAMKIEWGTGKLRHRTGPSTWADPVKWERGATEFHRERGRRQRVFCASLADVFDNEVDPQWRADLFALIRATPSLDWLLLTKRIGIAKDMLPSDWNDGYPNVWLGSTIVSQKEMDRDYPKLIATPARIHFLSCEPLQERVVLPNGLVDWVICGGESGPKARPMDPRWARSLRDQCVTAGVRFLFKQWGDWQPYNQGDAYTEGFSEARISTPDGGPPNRNGWPMYRVGKKRAGRELDDRTWDEFPDAEQSR